MKSTITCIILEDEARSLNLLKNLLKQIPGVQIAGAFQDPEEALAFMRESPPDLILLDIKMPKMDGFQFVEILEKEKLIRPFIFVTAFEEYMINALRKSAVDYLLKPVNLKQLEEAIDRFEEQSSTVSVGSVQEQVKSLQSELLRFNFKNGFEIVPRSEIIFLQADGNYTLIHLSDRRELTVSQNLGKFENLVLNHGFLKIHRSYIINPDYFRKVNRISKSCTLSCKEDEYKTRVSANGLKLLDDYFTMAD